MDGEKVAFVMQDVDVQNWPTLQEVRDAYIRKVLGRTNGKKAKAARILGINRRTLYRRPKK